MTTTLDMREIRYLNLFEKITGIRTRFCFEYNGTIIFCVPKKIFHKNNNKNWKNTKKLNEIIGKRIKIIELPEEIKDLEKFIKNIISPVTFNSIEIKDDTVIISGGKNKAALIGREKRRFLEMQKIIKDFFKKDFKII